MHWTRDQVGRLAYGGIAVGLAAGVLLYLTHQTAESRFVLAGTLGLLLALPIFRVTAVLVDELRRRDWGFVLLASAVLALLALTLIVRR